MESPKTFFRLLQSDHRRVHRLLAKRLNEAGFEVRRITKRANKDVWNVHMRRGSAPPGRDQQLMREAIRGVLASFDVKCSLRDLDVSLRGDRRTAAFIFDKGTIGSLSYFKGAEQWCADPWP